MDSSTHIDYVQKNNIIIGQKDNYFDSLGILDLSSVDLDNPETWLNESRLKSKQYDYNYKHYFDEDNNKGMLQSVPNVMESKKSIDTRTFTRPKKRFSRPSINDFEQLCINESGGESNIHNQKSAHQQWRMIEEENLSPATKLQPLHFDLSQPASENTFDSYMMNSCDYFHNMSPPSLVNSICSSAFASLMERSFIENDPVLKELRDKSYSEVALLQDQEAPMFQSITDSCSSLNFDNPEGFLKRITCSTALEERESLNNTVVIHEKTRDNSGLSKTRVNEQNKEIRNSDTDIFNMSSTTYPMSTESSFKYNGTYRKSPMRNTTFRTRDVSINSNNTTYNISDKKLDNDLEESIENDMNSSNTNTSGNLGSLCSKFNRLALTSANNIDELNETYSQPNLNQLSYNLDNNKDNENRELKEDSSQIIMDNKRMSLGSSDSLDLTSSISSSSKGSNKMLNMADIDAIAAMQERCLIQAMSTPKTNVDMKRLYINNCLSPIVSVGTGHLSDPEVSSARNSSIRPKIEPRKSKTPDYKHFQQTKLYANNQPREHFKRPMQLLSRASNCTNNNLRDTASNLGGSQMTISKKPSGLIRPPSVSSNLQRVGTRLGGSYTSLRPINAHLPIVPAATAPSNNTTNRAPSKCIVPNVNNGRASSAINLNKPAVDNNVPLRSRLYQASGLPRPTRIARPVSGIPSLQRNTKR